MALVVRELKVIPSTRVSLIKLFSRDDENLVLRNNEKIEWLAGGTLGKLFYKLYDEAGRAVPLTDEIASMIKVCLAYIMHSLHVLLKVFYHILEMLFLMIFRLMSHYGSRHISPLPCITVCRRNLPCFHRRAQANFVVSALLVRPDQTHISVPLHWCSTGIEG